MDHAAPVPLWRRSRRYVAAIALAALLGVACGAADQAAAPPVEVPVETGPVLPSVALPVLGEDGSFDLGALRGRPAVINFWAAWCPFCIDEMPDFEAVHQRLGDRVAFVGVDLEDDLALASDLAAETGVTYPLVVDADGALFRAVGGRGMPTTLLLDAEGRIVVHHTGPLTAEQLEELITTRLLG